MKFLVQKATLIFNSLSIGAVVVAVVQIIGALVKLLRRDTTEYVFRKGSFLSLLHPLQSKGGK